MPIKLGTLILESCVFKKCPRLIVLKAGLEFIHEAETCLGDHCSDEIVALLITMHIFLMNET